MLAPQGTRFDLLLQGYATTGTFASRQNALCAARISCMPKGEMCIVAEDGSHTVTGSSCMKRST